MNPMNEVSQNRIGGDSIDVMKWICSLLVVVIHCKPLLPYSELLNVVTAEGLCRIAVPFFFAVSGLLMCGKLSETADDSIRQKQICCKAAQKNIKLYLGWSAVYWIYYLPEWYAEHQRTMHNLLDQLRLMLIDMGSCYHFWYMVSLIYVMPFAAALFRRKTGELLTIILLLWPIQCLRYSYRWLPGGEVLPWDTMYCDALMNTVFCALPLLALGILCFRYHARLDSRKWLFLLVLSGILNMIELLLIYRLSPNKNHFEFLLTMPLVSFCLINFLLSVNLRFSDRRIPAALRGASVWIYCVHPMIIGAYGRINSGWGIRRFIIVITICLLTSAGYVFYRETVACKGQMKRKM